MSHRVALALSFGLTFLFAAGLVLGRDRLFPAAPATADPAATGETALVELVGGDALAAPAADTPAADASASDAPTAAVGPAARLASFTDIPAQGTADPAVQVAPIPGLETAPGVGGAARADAPSFQAEAAPAYGGDDSDGHDSRKHDSRKHRSDDHDSDSHDSGDHDD